MKNYSVIKKMINQFLMERKEKIAFSLYDGETVKIVSYQDFAKDILCAAGYFLSRNIKHQHISVMAPNSYDWLVTYFAVIGSGNIAVLMNQDLPADILQWQCDKADVSMVCTDQEVFELAKENLIGVECVCFEELKSDAAITVDMLYDTQEEDTIQMLFTSGTTGKSKAVEMTSQNISLSIKNFEEQYKNYDFTRIFTPIPFYHILGFLHVIDTLAYQKTVCLGRGVKYIFMDMAILNPEVLNTVPSIIDSLVKIIRRVGGSEEREKYIGKKLKLISYGGANLQEKTALFLFDINLIITVYYGMTEVSSTATWSHVDRNHFGTAGKFCKYIQFRIDEGELLMKGPTLMKGYYKDPEETAKIIEDGWLHTGDLGYVDEDGYFFLTGRKKNVIILSNGENVNPEEVEEKLGTCMDILECMVYSDGKGICADVFTENQDAVKAFVVQYNKGIPSYRQVYKVNYTATPLEKTGSGKIKRKVNIYE